MWHKYPGPRFSTQHIRRASWAWRGSSSSMITCSSFCEFCIRISSCPLRRIMAYFSVLNSVWPWRASTGWPMTTQGAVKCSDSEWLRYGSTSPYWLTGSQVNPHTGYPFSSTIQRSSRKSLCRVSSIGWNASLTPGVTRCTNAHYYWSDFCIP